MDVNGTRFHLLLGEQDWTGGNGATPRISRRDSQDGDLEWDEEQSSLTLRRQLFEFPASSRDATLNPAQRRGADRDRFDHWYWIDDDRRRVLILRRGQTRPKVFWPAPLHERRTRPGDFAPSDPPPAAPARPLQGLAVTEAHHLVVGVLDTPGLLVFDLHGGGPPAAVVSSDPSFHPIDMAAADGGGVWILDVDRQGARPPRFWRLDRHLQVTALRGPLEHHPAAPPDFRPSRAASPVRARRPAAGFDARRSVPLTADDPVAIVGLDETTVAILDRGDDGRLDEGRGARLWVHRGTTTVAAGVPLAGLRHPGHDLTFVPRGSDGDGLAGTVYVATADGNQAFAFRYIGPDQLELRLAYYPLRFFGGRALVASGGRVFYDSGDRWLPLVDRNRPRHLPAGRFESPPFDGSEPACVWHRLFLDACIPGGTNVLVRSRAAETVEDLAERPWEDEPRLLRRERAELPFYGAYPSDAGAEAGTWELLLQRARGRYLQVALDVHGSGHATPRLLALRVTYPRFSYLHEYLPDVYAAGPDGGSFLERYLANVEGLYTDLEEWIAGVEAAFDVRSTPEGYLDWLGGWVGVALDADWSSERRRLFIANAVRLFAQRGTVPGLLGSIRVASAPPERGLPDAEGACTSVYGSCARHGSGASEVRILERYLVRQRPGTAFGPASDPDRPVFVDPRTRWSPEFGADDLHERYRAYLLQRYPSAAELADAWDEPGRKLQEVTFPPLTPSHQVRARDRRDFVRDRLGITYADVAAEDTAAYRRFLVQRYRHVGAYRDAHGLTDPGAPTSLSAVELPTVLPEDPVALRDWVTFVSVVIPMAREAHRFTVLVPVPVDAGADHQQRLLRVARRVVDADRPAHTSYTVEPFWAAFRVGQARVGFETQLGQGSRFFHIVLGRGDLAAGYLAAPPAWWADDRTVVGRDRMRPGSAGRQGGD